MDLQKKTLKRNVLNLTLFSILSSAPNIVLSAGVLNAPVPVTTQLFWANEAPNQFFHEGVEDKMIHGDHHLIFDSSSLPIALTNPSATGAEVTVNLGAWEERTPNVAEGWQSGEQINVIFVDADDNVIWRSAFTDDLPDLSSNAYATSSINQTVTITQPIDKIYIAHKSHSKYNQDLGWIGSVYPDFLCMYVTGTPDTPEPPIIPDPPPVIPDPPPPPALDFGNEGRFNIRELNTHKVVVEQHDNGNGNSDDNYNGGEVNSP